MKMELRRVTVRRLGVGVVGAIALSVLIWLATNAPRANADPPEPVITSGPAIDGTPEVGAVLTASGNWSGSPAAEPTWTWLRCAESCTLISSGTSATHRVSPSDIGAALRVILTVTNRHGSDERSSEPTAVVAAPTPLPIPLGDADPNAHALIRQQHSPARRAALPGWGRAPADG